VRLAYFDCFSGISGDMALGALVHAGADLDRIIEQLESLPVEGFLIEREDTGDHGIVAVRIHVKTRPQGLIRTYASVRGLLEASSLTPAARRTAGRIFSRLADGMGRVHGKEPELVTFHEMGETEVMVEVVGVAVALDLLAVERVFSSPIPTGMGMAHHEHGLTPIPGPEVVELLQAVPTYSRGIPVDLVTPVGAAIASAVVEGFGDMPMMRAERIGYGAGHPRLDFPNLLRVVIGEEEPAWRRTEAPPASVPAADGRGRQDAIADHPSAAARLAAPPAAWTVPALEGWVEALADDPGEAARGELLEPLFEAGATDAWAAPIVRRGGRPGLRITVVCTAATREAVLGAMASLPGAAPLDRHGGASGPIAW
jgi:uncharacterized protein (TIGR00299 family) protein